MSTLPNFSRADIAFFLHLGYFPDYQEKVTLDYSGVDKARYAAWDQQALMDEGIALFRQAIADNFTSGARHVVPISGGLDSRALLAGLLEFTDAASLETYTFGTPGSYDFEIGKQVAKAAGVRHSAIDLTQVAWRHEDLLDNARANDCQTFLFHHVPLPLLEAYRGAMIWSGYIGDAVVGGHLKPSPAPDLATARQRYVKKRAEVKSMALCPPELLDSLSARVGGGFLPPEILTYDEQVLFAEVGKLVAPHILIKGFDYRTPFINNDFWRWGLSLDNRWREGRNLFTLMMRQAYPALFSLPVKSNVGLPLAAGGVSVFARRAVNKLLHLGIEKFPFLPLPSSPNTNFIDYARQVRQRDDLRAVSYAALQALQARGVVDWLDIDALWQAHLARRVNCGDALALLVSLEINLQARGA